jgi:hypothetical protein
MSGYTIIQDATLELRRRIYSALTSAPDADFGMTAPETDITLSPPRDEMTDSPRLSLFLYHIEPDGHLRNQNLLAAGQEGLRFPPMPLQLNYLITPLDDEEDQNHLILGRIVQHFHDQPFLSSLNGTPLDDSHGGSSPRLRIAFETLSSEQLSQVWHALNTGYRLSVAYTVRVVAIDSDQGVADARRVVDAHTAVGLIEAEN